MLFLFEYAACGRVDLPESIAVEGLGMFKSLRRSLKDSYSFVDPRYHKLFPECPPAGDPQQEIAQALERCSQALIVAPESDHLLLRLTEQVEKAGVENLGSSSRAIKICSDKYRTLRKLRGLRKPRTDVFNGSTSLDLPIVAKPRVGEGGEGCFLVESEKELENVPRGYMLQELVEGRAGSASLFASEEGLELVSLQLQVVRNFSYLGCDMPLELEEEDVEELFLAGERIEGLNGLFGVDFVIGSGGIALLEVNPRVTTSLAGFEKAYSLGLGDFLEGRFPRRGRKTEVRKVRGREHNPFISTGGFSIVVRRAK